MSPKPLAAVPTLPAAFVAVVEEHSARVWRFLRYQGVPESDLPDASQEVFLVVHRRLGEFRGEARISTWLYEICLHVARASRRRTAARREDLGSPMIELAVVPQADANDSRRIVLKLLDQLPEDQRIVVTLHDIEELPMAEVAAVCGCPIFTAWSRLRLARKRMKQILVRDGGRE